MRTKKISRAFDLKGAKSKANEPQSIRLLMNIYGKRLPYYTGYIVAPKNWDYKKQRVKLNTGVTDAVVINRGLEKILKIFDDTVTQFQREEIEVTHEKVAEVIKQQTGKSAKKSGDFWAFVERFIDESKERVNPRSGTKISPETIRIYKNIQKLLKEFEAADNHKMRFDNINEAWFARFNTWATDTKQYTVNYIDKIIGTLHTWLNDAVRQGETQNTDHKQIKTKPIKSQKIYLTENELQTIANAELPGKYDNARDLFLLGCFTGLRYSDTSTIKREHIDEKNDIIKIHQIKTGELVAIPLHPILKKILKKRNWSPPHSISNQKLNVYVKEVVKLAGITAPVEIQQTKGGKRLKTIVPKCDLVTTHTARRSVASNLYKKRVPAQTIMKLTGHKTLSAFLAYICLDDTEHFDIIKSIWNSESKSKPKSKAKPKPKPKNKAQRNK